MLLSAPSLSTRQVTLTGVVSDAMCGATHMMKDTSAADCTRALRQAGLRWAGVVRDSVLHGWPALRVSFEILLTHPISRPLGAIGRKATFVHGTRDKVTPLTRIHQLAQCIGAAVVEVPSDHLGYREQGKDAVLRLFARPAPAALNPEPAASASAPHQVRR